MSIAAALALQSLPFAGLAFVTMSHHRDLFVVLYVSALGLILAAAAAAAGQYGLPIRI